MTIPTANRVLPEPAPEVTELVQVRSRRWPVEEIVPAPTPSQSALVPVACAADDAQGKSPDPFRDHVLDRRIHDEEGSRGLVAKDHTFETGT